MEEAADSQRQRGGGSEQDDKELAAAEDEEEQEFGATLGADQQDSGRSYVQQGARCGERTEAIDRRRSRPRGL